MEILIVLKQHFTVVFQLMLSHPLILSYWLVGIMTKEK